MNNNTLWKIRHGDGQMEFPARSTLHRLRKKPESFWYHPSILLILLIGCAVIDLYNFKQTFDSFLFDRPFARVVGIGAFILAFDVIPLYVGNDAKKRSQGYKSLNRTIVNIMIATFVLAFFANLALRITTKDLILPDTNSIFSGNIFGEIEDAGAESANTNLPIIYAVFGSIVPLITSLGSLAISYAMANPIYKEKLELEKQQIIISSRINELKSLLNEYTCNDNYLDRLKGDDEERYSSSMKEIEAHKQYLIDYTAQRIKEHEANPTSTNILSKPHIKVVA